MPGSAQRAVARITLSVLVLLLAACTQRPGLAWNPSAAAGYLDRRAQQWFDWPRAARAQGTVCISCHTALPYALARGALGQMTGDTAASGPQRRLLADVLERVRLWSQLPPYYPEQALASRGTEAVLNALILADQDGREGHLSAATVAAFDDMWALQRTSGDEAGSWPWIRFDNEPWEAYDSAYYGATLAALALGSAPQDYRLRAEAQVGFERLRDYLARAYGKQSPLNRIDLLWAAARLPGLIDPSVRAAILREGWSLQRPDGGWNLASLMPQWRRRDGTAQPQRSDGYATGLMTLVLQQAGVTPGDARLGRGLRWLQSHQSFWSGGWSADSLNRKHGLRDGTVRHFMDDAASAFAVLALTQAQQPASSRIAAAPRQPGYAVGSTR